MPRPSRWHHKPDRGTPAPAAHVGHELIAAMFILAGRRPAVSRSPTTNLSVGRGSSTRAGRKHATENPKFVP